MLACVLPSVPQLDLLTWVSGLQRRNDVFSDIFTRWKKPPRTVIYDFACALAPYCRAREPDFWANTLFVIDQLHQHDHTKCSRACF